MRGFIVSAVLLVAITVAFISGMFSAQTGLVMVAFCASPFVLFATGWTARGALGGKRIMLVSDEQPRQHPRTPEREMSRLNRQRRDASVSTTNSQF